MTSKDKLKKAKKFDSTQLNPKSKFNLGDPCRYTLKTLIEGETLHKTITVYVVAIRVYMDHLGMNIYEYLVSKDAPSGPYSRKHLKDWVKESSLMEYES